MDISHNFTLKSEKTDVKSEEAYEETLEMDVMVKIEIEPEKYIQHFYTCENQTLNVEDHGYNKENLYFNLINRDNVEDSSEDGSFRSLQGFHQEECMVCHKVFMNRYCLIKHNLTHLKLIVDLPKTYQCGYCSVFFTEKNKLSDHIYSKHFYNYNVPGITKRIYDCTICRKKFKYRQWNEHVHNVHGNRKFKCEICNASFKCERYLRKHNRFHHEGGVRRKHSNQSGLFKCYLCPKTFHINDCLNKHIQNCHSSPVECEICKSKLKSIVYLRTHMRRVHYDDGKVHKCNICMKQFKSPRYVRVHIKNSHANLNARVHLSCECGETYTCVRKLENHLEVCPVVCRFETRLNE